MDWIEISITTNTQGADIVSEALMRAGSKGTQIIDRADVPDPSKPSGYWELIDPELIEQMPEEVVVKAWFMDPEQIAPLAEAVAHQRFIFVINVLAERLLDLCAVQIRLRQPF